MQPAVLVLNSQVNRASIPDQCGANSDCLAQESFALLQQDEDFGGWATFQVQCEDAKLVSTEEKKEIRRNSRNNSNSIEDVLQIQPPTPPHHKCGVKTENLFSNHNEKKTIPKLSVSRREIRKGLYDHQPNIMVSFGDVEDDDNDDDGNAIIPIESSMAEGRSMKTSEKGLHYEPPKPRVLRRSSRMEASEPTAATTAATTTLSTSQSEGSNVLSCSRRERWKRQQGGVSSLSSRYRPRSARSNDSSRNQLSSTSQRGGEDESKDDDPIRTLERIPRSRSFRNVFCKQRSENQLTARTADDESITIANSEATEDADIISRGSAQNSFTARTRRGTRPLPRAKSMPIHEESFYFKPPKRTRSEDPNSLLNNLGEEERFLRRPAMKSNLVDGVHCKTSEHKKLSTGKHHRQLRRRNSIVRKSSETSGRPLTSNVMEELEDLVQSTSTRRGEEPSRRRRERRATTRTGEGNHKKLERSKSSDSLTDRKRHTKSDKPGGRSDSMHKTSSHRRNKSKRTSKNGGSEDRGAETRPKRSSRGEKSCLDDVPQKSVSRRNKSEKPSRDLTPPPLSRRYRSETSMQDSLINLVIIVDPENSDLGEDSNHDSNRRSSGKTSLKRSRHSKGKSR